MADKKTISGDVYLKAFALYIMAQKMFFDAERFRKLCEEALGQEDQSRVCDGVFQNEDFDDVLKQIGITVEPKP